MQNITSNIAYWWSQPMDLSHVATLLLAWFAVLAAGQLLLAWLETPPRRHPNIGVGCNGLPIWVLSKADIKRIKRGK